jgi:hypothetical protein
MSNVLEVKVTAEDIKRGRRGSCSLCPIALATMRKFHKGHKVNVSVTDDCLSIILDNEQSFNYVTPRAAEDFMNNFDSNKPVKPKTFKFPFWF